MSASKIVSRRAPRSSITSRCSITGSACTAVSTTAHQQTSRRWQCCLINLSEESGVAHSVPFYRLGFTFEGSSS
jgi:hypothetical protein